VRPARALRGTKNRALARWASPTRIKGKGRPEGEPPDGSQFLDEAPAGDAGSVETEFGTKPQKRGKSK
jgi:hypothetical protein